MLPNYDKLTEEYRLFINNEEVDFVKVVDINKTSVSKVKITDSKDGKIKIMVELRGK